MTDVSSTAAVDSSGSQQDGGRDGEPLQKRQR